MQFMIKKSDNIFSIIIMNNIGYTITRDILEYDIVIVRCHVSLVSNNSYMPLIDMVPSYPDMIITATMESQRMTEECGHTSTVFTSDQQLYRVTVKERLYRSWCGVNTLGDSGVNALGNTSAFVNRTVHLLLTRRGKIRMDGVGIVFEF